MPPGATTSKPFRPGTTGWGASDLDDPDVEAKWFQGRYEIIEGVLSEMPAAYYSGSRRLFRLQHLIATYQQSAGIRGDFANEVDIVLDEPRVVRADAVWMTPQDDARQMAAVANAPPLATSAAPRDPDRTRILVPPTLIIESLSPGHEFHDRRIKRKWYAEFGVPNYWLFDPFARSLECLVLEGSAYRDDQAGRENDTVRPRLFPGLAIPLSDLWAA